MLLEISSAKLIIVLIFIPAAGNISNSVTTGPCFTFITRISILKSRKTFSKRSDFAFIFSLSKFFFVEILFDSSISSDGDK